MKGLLLIAVLLLARTPARADSCLAAQCVRDYSMHYHVPPEFIAALIDVESRWNPRAVSNKGAMGLMQLMPATAKRYGAFDPFNAEQNIAAGTRYVTALMWEFHADLRLVAAAYYAGDRSIGREQLSYRRRCYRPPPQQQQRNTPVGDLDAQRRPDQNGLLPAP